MKYAEMTAAERLGQQHAMESAEGWQYARVWRFAHATDKQPVLPPPREGDGWEINDDAGDRGQVELVPGWSDGRVVMQSTRWRRKFPGMTNAHPRRVVHVRVTWNGDPKP